MAKKPVLLELEDDAPQPTPAEVAPIMDAPVEGAAMQTVAALAARRPSRLARWFWSLLLAVLGFFVSLAAWNTVEALVLRNPILGYAAALLVAAFVVVALAVVVKELAAFSRLARIDRIKEAAASALLAADLKAAQDVVKRLKALYGARQPGRAERLAAQSDGVLDADGLITIAERELLSPLDQQALREVEQAARQVATMTALMPMALIDVLAALTINLRMIRRVAEVYGGRSGTLGAWRLTRAVFGHLVATGAVAVGDDLLGSVAGGSLLGKVSRRFGEGVVNAALTGRVGIAAMEVCRPLAFNAVPRPSVSATLRRSVTGLFEEKE